MINKCLFPAAGYGTRFLPVTKAVPKEMLPVLTKPLLQYGVEEALSAGISNMAIITGRGKRAIEDHFDNAFELEAQLIETSKEHLLKEIKEIIASSTFTYVRQNKMLGLGDAILSGKPLIGNEPFAVILADDLCDYSDKGIIANMVKIYKEYKCPIIAIEEEGNDNVIIHHCPSGYPARLESIHLKMIPTLKKMFPNYFVAFSDHSPGWEMDIAAISLGAGMVEKTITLDRFTKSCEHSYSLEGDSIKDFVSAVRNIEVALGDERRILPKDLRLKRKNTRRSPYALRKIFKGELISRKDFEFKRPGKGISEEEFKILLNTSISKDLEKGNFLDNE